MCRYRYVFCLDDGFVKHVMDHVEDLIHEVCREMRFIHKKIPVCRRHWGECVEPFSSVDIKEDEVIIEVELPGVDKERIKLWLSEDRERIYLEAFGDKRKYCDIYRLPYKTDPDKVEAEYQNGLLVIKARKIRAGYEIKIK